MNKYLPRIVDNIVKDKLSYMGAYLLRGVNGVVNLLLLNKMQKVW